MAEYDLKSILDALARLGEPNLPHTYYVGKGGDDSASGLTWKDRVLTLNGIDSLRAGDIVFLGRVTA